MRISDWSSDVCSSDLTPAFSFARAKDIALSDPQPLSFQDLILTLQHYWSERGCVILQPYDLEMGAGTFHRSEEHTSELQSLMRISYAVFCLKKQKSIQVTTQTYTRIMKHNSHQLSDTN